MTFIVNVKRFLWVVLLIPAGLTAQTFNWDAVKQQVISAHPLAKQADYLLGLGSAAILKAKGAFDPKIYGTHDAKSFNGKNYFQLSESGLKWQARGGLELKGAYQLATGNFINPENTLPATGQALLGFEWSLLQGLLYDERRANLDAAQYENKVLQARRNSVVNDLLLDAAKSYWNWVFARNALGITQKALEQAEIRHQGLRESFFQGDKPAFDTLETFIQLQSRQIDLQFARVDASNAAIQLSGFLWSESQMVVDPSTLPFPPTSADIASYSQVPFDLDALAQDASETHPDIEQYRAKLKILQVEKRLKNEMRKPVVNFNYNLLGDGWRFFPTAGVDGPGVVANDIKWGLDVSYPLLNRKARGDFQAANIKIAQTNLELTQKQQAVNIKVRQYGNEMTNLRAQANAFFQITENYRVLLEGETEKFRQGESSIFLINTREQRWLDAQLKYLKLLTELRKTEISLLWAAGKLID